MRFSRFFDPLIILPVVGLTGVSLFILGSTTPALFSLQAGFFLAGIVLCIFFAFVDYRIWTHFVWFIYFAALLLLMLSFLGPQVRGATRWLELGGIRLQPSELIKPFIILIFAHIISEKPPREVKTFGKICLLFLPFLIFVFKQPDLGNTIVYLLIFIGLLFIGDLSRKLIWIGTFLMTLILPLSWFILKEYQKQRIISFVNPNSDPAGAGYNALQAIIAIGSGRFTGLGLGKGTQSRLLFLPEYHTDFAFASLGEELGFLGGSLVIFFYFLLLGRILLVSFKSEDAYTKLLATGIFTQYFIQVFINIGMNIGILPITGITLPLISYGGSSLLSTFIGLGLILSIIQRQKSAPLVIR